MTEPEMSPAELRLRGAVEAMLAGMTDERRTECELLGQMQPGITLHPITGSDDLLEARWAGAGIGALSRHWVMTGEPGPEGSC